LLCSLVIVIISLSLLNLWFSIVPSAWASTFTTDTTISNDTTITGTWTVNAGVTLTIAPGVTLDIGTYNHSARLALYGHIVSTGAVINLPPEGWLVSYNGTITGGVINVSGRGGTFEVVGLFNNGATINNGNRIEVEHFGDATFYNNGTINNDRNAILEVSSHSHLINEEGATINNIGLIGILGTLENRGAIYNYSCRDGVGSIETFGNGFTGNEPISSDFCFVVPESPIGSIAMVAASLAALGTFAYFSQYRNKAFP